jgi:NAD+ synthase (glutamine-hydrolysing)
MGRPYPGAMPRLRVAAAQLNMVVGDLEGNAALILQAYEAAEAAECDLVVFPELTVTGYPPEDLLLRPAFVAQANEMLDKLASRTARAAAVIGFPELDRELHNAAAVCANGRVYGVYRKRLLPNYAVFDEQRYFVAPREPLPLFEIGGVKVGISICEDAWSPTGPILAEAEGGADLIVNLNASPYYAQRLAERESMLATRAADAAVPIVYANLVGGQDELVFDGASLVFDEQGGLIARAVQFRPDLLVTDIDVRDVSRSRVRDRRGTIETLPLPETHVSDRRAEPARVPPRIEPTFSPVQEVYEALVLGTRDYVRKNGFTDVLVGLSGGIDSALVAAIAADALGAEHVVGVLMPSRYSSAHSISDAEALVANLGIRSYTVPIEPAHAAFETMLAPLFEGTAPNLAEENVQARVRGNVLMTISNKFGWMVLTTGNKSEMATGYATLYGDMAGGFAVIKDVPKTLVYALCNDLNERTGREVIPQNVIDKPPSAELAPGQLDSDSLPPYEVLDPIIEGYVEDDLSVAELVARGHDSDLTQRVARMVDRNEYKRRQAAPGVRVSPKAFGKDRRLPITNRWPG